MLKRDGRMVLLYSLEGTGLIPHLKNHPRHFPLSVFDEGYLSVECLHNERLVGGWEQFDLRIAPGLGKESVAVAMYQRDLAVAVLVLPHELFELPSRKLNNLLVDERYNVPVQRGL